jgi:hypothetical protein
VREPPARLARGDEVDEDRREHAPVCTSRPLPGWAATVAVPRNDR